MAMKTGSLDYWRNYFRAANSDIFNIIDYAIMVAASDCPKEFRLRRDRIAERLFSVLLARCSGCERIDQRVAGDGGEDEDVDDDRGCKNGFDRDGCEFEAGGSKESKVNSSRDDQGEMNMNQVSNFSFGEAEALTDEIEEESQIVGEVLRIKELLHNKDEQSDSVLFDSLRRLQLMALTVDTLKATEIGKAVNGFRRHNLKQIRRLAQTLIDGWKEIVDDWYNATAAIKCSVGSEGTPDSKNPSVVDDEEGLPSPPLDEGAFFTTQTMELSQFFDGMDDDGNPGNNGAFRKNRENGRKPSDIMRRKQQNSNEVKVVANDHKNQIIRKQEPVMKPNKPLNAQAGTGRVVKPSIEQRVIDETKFQQKGDKVTVPRKPITSQRDLKSSDEVKLEATKRKLQESYQQAENAKKQRTIQVMELRDLPKQGLGHRNPQMKPGGHNRQWANGRR